MEVCGHFLVLIFHHFVFPEGWYLGRGSIDLHTTEHWYGGGCGCGCGGDVM